MANFFEAAPFQGTLQQQIIESIFHKQTVVGSFPVGYPTGSLYRLPAMTMDGMAVVICPDTLAVERHRADLAAAGMGLPEAVVLDGNQPPHEERDIRNLVSRGRVKLILTTAQRFSTLVFLQMLAHSRLSFLVIEQAELLLPGFSNHYRYGGLLKGLEALGERPPLVVLTRPLPAAHFAELSDILSLGYVVGFHLPPLSEKTRITVRFHLTRRQKFQSLLWELAGRPARGQVGRLGRPGSVLIHTASRSSFEQLFRRLQREGLSPIHGYHPDLPLQTRREVEQDYYREPDAIVVCRQGADEHLSRPVDRPERLLLWDPPASLDEFLGLCFRRCAPDDGLLEVVVLHHKEDLIRQRYRMGLNDETEDHLPEYQHALALQDWERWLKSERCRYTSLMDYWQTRAGEMPARGAFPFSERPTGRCGDCDVCLAAKGWQGRLQQLLHRLVY
jgi:hypothetical protein